MLIVFLALLLLFVVITVVGHGSWLLLAAMFRSLRSENPTDGRSRRPSLSEDLAAFRRLITYFRVMDLVDSDEADRLESLVEKAQTEQRAPAIGAVPHRNLSAPAPHAHKVDTRPQTATTNPDPHVQAQPVTAILVEESPTEPAFVPKMEPRRALSEVLQNFLAAHNIRWGELTAGILIVVCSIGLVTSLWSTLTATNRLIPAAVFLAAVAAIEAAGLYTLRRWKLRHTSRAVLVIATMLIPLSVMAGISVAGSGEGAVSLQDPMTWIAIAVGWLLSTTLIYFAGQALIGRPRRWSWVVAIGLPTIMLPIAPAISRLLESNAAWVAMIAMIATAGLLTLDGAKILRRKGKTLLPARYQQLFLLNTLAMYALALLAAMFVLRLGRSVNTIGPLCISAIPTLVALLGTIAAVRATNLTSSRRIQTTSIGLVVGLLIIAQFPLMMQRFEWLLGWGVLTAVSAIAVGISLRQRSLMALCPLVLAIIAPPAASVWLAHVPWDSTIQLWQRYITGYGAIATTLIGVSTVGLAAYFHRDKETVKLDFLTTEPLMQVGQVLTAVGLCVATVVGLGPDAWLAPMPRVVITALIFLVAGMTFLRLRHFRFCPMATSVPLAIAMATIFLPARVWWGTESIVWLPALIKTLLGTSLAVAAIAELARPWWKIQSLQLANFRMLENWWRTGCSLALVTWLFIPFCVNEHPSFAMGASLVASLILCCGPIRGFLKDWVFVSELTCVGWLVTLVFAIRPEWMSWADASSSLTSAYVIIAIIGMTIACWECIGMAVNYGPLQRLSFAIRRDPIKLHTLASDVLQWSFISVAAFQLVNLIAARATPDVELVIVGWGFAVAASACLILSLVCRFRRLHLSASGLISSLSRIQVLLPSVLTAFMLANLVPIHCVASASTQLVAIAWTSLLALSVLATFVWQLGRHGCGVDSTWVTATRPGLFGSGQVLVIACGAVVSAVVAAFRITDPAEMAIQSGLNWPIISIILCVAAGACVIGLIGRLFRSLELRYLAVGIPVVAAPLLLPLVVANPALADVVCVAAWASFLGLAFTFLMHQSGLEAKAEHLAWPSEQTVSPTPVGYQPSLQIAWFGIGVAGIVAMAWSVVLLLNLRFEWIEAFGSVNEWSSLYVVAAILFVTKVGQYWIAQPAMRRLIAVTLAAGLMLATAHQFQWFASLAMTLPQGLAWSWIITSIAFGAYGLWKKQTSVIAFTAVLITLVNTNAILAALINAPSHVLWSVAAVVLSALAIACFVRMRWLIVSQGIAVLGAISAVLLQLSIHPEAENFFAGSVLSLAGIAVVWSILSRYLPRFDASKGSDPALISALSAAACVLALPILSLVFENGFQGWDAQGAVSGLTAIASMALVTATLWLAPVRRSAATIAYMATQLLFFLGVAFFAKQEPTIYPYAWLIVSATVVAGAWMFSWPWSKRALTAQGEWRIHEFRLTVAIVTTAILVGLATTSVLCFDVQQITRALVITSVLGTSVVIGGVAGWKREDETSLFAGALLPTISVLLFGAGLVQAALTIEEISGPIAVVTSMRLFLASIIFTPSMIWIARKIFGLHSERWRIALHRGAVLGLSLAGVSLVAMFTSEMRLWGDEAIRQVPDFLVAGTAVFLAAVSLAATICGIFPSTLRPIMGETNDKIRTAIIFAAQIFGGLTWLHVYLCRPEVALMGLRPYWPYVVMALAFASAGVTQFAKVRQDIVLQNAMRKSTFLLPLIPVIGFWLTPGAEEWFFTGGRTSYTFLLFMAALFYGILAIAWPKDRIPRIAGVVLANAALWVLLVQTPSLSFAAHPQFWLIPPALCVLFATFLEREHLQTGLATSMRYGATLVIYVSSTADILLDQVGSTLWGPMVLILLALGGMVTGVVTRTRAFLYLGSLFVFIGVLSMVWQAGRAIDQSWPWWVFGITLGLLMLTGLMYLEKNRAALKRLANELAQWQP